MDLIWTAYRPSTLTEGGEVVVPANFGVDGGARYDQWSPTIVPPPDYDPRIQQWNVLWPVVIGKVTDVAQFQATQQAGLTQLSQIRPTTYVPPGTASVVVR